MEARPSVRQLKSLLAHEPLGLPVPRELWGCGLPELEGSLLVERQVPLAERGVLFLGHPCWA